jgi:hypothetical protein
VLATTTPSWGRPCLEILGVHSEAGRGRCTADEHPLGGPIGPGLIGELVTQAPADADVDDCIVLDISVSGARISFSTPAQVPEVVALRLRDGSTYPARRSWARGAELGLEFIGRVGASGDEGRIRRAWAALEAVQAADPVSWLQILQAERFFGDETLHQAAKAAEAAHMRLEAALRPHAVRTAHEGLKATE